ncbi:hypothetical protein CEXT_296321 [Caerostris extrusa]|uniref:Uncharacterized protein n=1 Tax=Caerostris extrusa TaxID=172846 RepID=A0AAV4TET4_CAEEX|nr:hypothetical protein CEXT_296321 [Caerostris extrusa]
MLKESQKYEASEADRGPTVYAVKPSLKEHWTDEIEESWLQLFRYISYIMKRAMMETYTSQEIPVDNKT